MKKFLIGMTIILGGLLITGCGKVNTEKVESRNAEINKEISDSVKNDTIEGLQLIDSNILLTSLGLETEDVSDYIGKIPVYNRLEGTMYVAIKPASGKKEKVKRALDLYVSGLESRLSMPNDDSNTNENELKLLKEITKEEYKGYYIYVSGSNKDQILKILKEHVK